MAHKCLLKHGKHHSPHFQHAWDLYGENNFVFEVIEECNKDILIEREQFYFDSLKPEYNISKIAGKTEMTPEIRKKLSDACRGRPSAFKGRKHTKGSRKKISMNHADCGGKNNAFYGKHHTKEFKARLSKLKSGKNNPFYGKKRPDHSKRMLGKGNSFFGKQHTEAFKINSSLTKCGLTIEMSMVKEMRDNGLTQSQISDVLSCSRSTICRVLNNKIKAFQCDESKGNRI